MRQRLFALLIILLAVFAIRISYANAVFDPSIDVRACPEGVRLSIQLHDGADRAVLTRYVAPLTSGEQITLDRWAPISRHTTYIYLDQTGTISDVYNLALYTTWDGGVQFHSSISVIRPRQCDGSAAPPPITYEPPSGPWYATYFPLIQTRRW